MKYVLLNNTGLRVSRLGMGTMRFPVNNFNGSVNEEEAVGILQFALSRGINYIDTGYTYHHGKSEVIVGKAIKLVNRKEIVLTTKCPVWEINTEKDFYYILNEQLSRLGTPYIDCYLLHALGEERWNHVKQCGIMKMMEKAKKDGLIRHIGFSFHDNYTVLEKILSEYPSWELCQIQYNYIDTDKQAGSRGLKLAKEKGLDVFIMEPLHGGRLVNPPIRVQEVLPTVKDPVEWAFDFLYDQEAVDVVLSGMSDRDQIDKNILYLDNAFPGMLSDEEKQMFIDAKCLYDTMSFVKCTGCNYCEPCSKSINISRVFSLYNLVGRSHYREAKEEYDRLSYNASDCCSCGVCETKCPQSLSISLIMKDIDAAFQKAAPEINLEDLRIKWPARYKRIIGD